MSLNETQAAAVTQRGSHLLVLAGAGTGKTRVITHRIAALVKEGMDPRAILAVTFTNKAAKEMKARLEKMGVSCGRDDGPWIGTFHATGLRVLKLHAIDLGYSKGFTIYDEDSSEAIIKALLADVRGGDNLTPAMVRGCISSAKDAGRGPTQLAEQGISERWQPIIGEVFRKYNEELKRSNAMDFADLLGNTVKLLRMGENSPASWLLRKFRQVLVDEFQDTNPLQMQMIDLIGSKSEICVVGDDDQSIYGWRNADPGGMMRFSKRPGVVVVKLEANYRSTPQILDCANAVIAKNLDRLGKTLRSSRAAGSNVQVSRLPDETAEANYVASKIVGPKWGDHAILYRTHAQSRVIEEALRRKSIPYTIVGGLRFYDRSEIKDLLSYYRLAVNPKSDVDLIRIVNKPARGLGAKAIGALKTAASKANSSMFEAIARSPDPKFSRMRKILETLTESVSLPLRDFHKVMLKATWYRDALADTAKLSGSGAQREAAAAKLENVDEMASDIDAFAEEHPGATVASYIEHVALVSSFDRETGPSVSLMTVHAAKGLEFPRVFLVGVEEGILPHANSLKAFEKKRDVGPIEEERRLTYVAITRAMNTLDITLTQRRSKAGQAETVTPSRFLQDLPRSRISVSGMDSGWWKSP